MEIQKALRVSTLLLEIGLIILLIGSFYSITSVLSTTLDVKQEINIDKTDPVTIPLTFNPVNEGFLETRLTVTLELMSNSEIIASDTAAVDIPPGSQEQINLELVMSLSDATKYLYEESDITWTTFVETSTLSGFLKMSDRISFNGEI